MKIKDVLVSPDLVGGLAITVLTCYIFPEPASSVTSAAILGMQVQVVSIVFSVYLAALALILAGGNEEFVLFLETACGNAFSGILATFKWTLGLLALTLMSSGLLFSVTIHLAESKTMLSGANRGWFIANAGLFTWGLLAVLMSVRDAIKYFEYRVTYATRKR